MTITPQLYLFNVINQQIATSYDSSGTQRQLRDGYDQPVLRSGRPGTRGGTCPAAATAPCTDNPDYGKITTCNNPRLLRVAIKVTF